MTKSLHKNKLDYFVVGLKDYPGESDVAFLQSRSSKPAEDIERALSLGCDYAVARLLDGEEAKKELGHFIETLRFQSISRDKTNERVSLRRLKDGTLTYNVFGLAPDGRVDPDTGRNLHKTIFAEQVSVTPSDDVKRALRAGSVIVRVGVNYELSEDQKLEDEYNRKREVEAMESLKRVKPKLLQASMPGTSKPEYVVVGFKKDRKGNGSVGGYLMPMTATPGKGAETALVVRCHWIAVNLLAGRRDLAEQVGKYYENLEQGKKTSEDSYKLFPVSQPPEGIDPPVGDGPTICNIIGKALGSDGSLTVRWKKSGSISPSDDVELAIRAGSTEVIVEVTKWRKSGLPTQLRTSR